MGQLCMYYCYYVFATQIHRHNALQFSHPLLFGQAAWCVPWGIWIGCTYFNLIFTWLHCTLPAHFQGDHLYCQPCQQSGQGPSQTCDCETLFQILLSADFNRLGLPLDCHLSHLRLPLVTWLLLNFMAQRIRHLPKCSVAAECQDSTTAQDAKP